MKYFLVIVFIFISLKLEAQNCLTHFTNELQNQFNQKNKYFYKKAVKDINNSLKIKDKNKIEIINIPVLFSTKKAVRIIRKGKCNIENFFCYLNPVSLTFNKSIILINNEIKGVLILSANPSKKLQLSKEINKLDERVIEEFMIVKPDGIFTIYNIPRCYWYVLNNELFVFAEHEGDYKSYNANDYVVNYLTESAISFIYHKRVVVISGR